jgi:hypothetical protein
MTIQVGEFPGIQRQQRRLIPAPKNPLDKSTIISIFPKEIEERKATVQPGLFKIQAGSFDKPSCLTVGTSSWWKEVDDTQPLLEIPVSSISIADSFVKDYCNGLLACNMSDQMPGLFYLPGEWNAETVKKEQMPIVLKYLGFQKKWFLELVRIADILWSRSNGNPLAISQDARLACKELNIHQKPWLGDLQTAELIRCVACGSLRNGLYPVCPTCKAVADPELAKKLNIVFAQ